MSNPEIQDSDYNSIRNKIEKILGDSPGTFGYGQTLVSQPVFEGETITRQQWLDLRDDLISIKIHQEGELPNIPEPSGVIAFGADKPAELYDRLADELTETRFNIGSVTETEKVVRTFTTAWSTTATFTLTINFNDSDESRKFFNSGSKIKFVSSRTGGSSTIQNQYWTNTLNIAGDVLFGADTVSLVNFYTLTDGFQTFYFISPDPTFPDNYYQIDARCDVSNNATGTATQVEFRVRWVDGFTNPLLDPTGDRVDGTLRLVVSELNTSANLFKDGEVDGDRSWNIVGPSYTASAISAPPAIALPGPRSYTIVADKANVNEDQTITFDITTNNFPAGTILYWNISSNNPNVDTDDFLDPIVGTVTTVGGSVPPYQGQAIVTLRLNPDKKREGNETAQFVLKSGSNTGPELAGGSPISFNIVDTSKPTYVISTNKTSVREGDSVVFTVTTTNLPDGSVIYWQIFQTSGTINELDFVDEVIVGESPIIGNKTTITISISEDRTTESTERFRLRLAEVQFGTPGVEIVAQSSEITIQDTSQTPPVEITITVPSTVNEGETVLGQVTTKNIEVPTFLYWKIVPVGNFNQSDLTFGSLLGTVTIDELGTGSFNFGILEDFTTEGSESFNIELYQDSDRTIKLKNSSLITVNDTSKSSSYSISVSPTSVDEGGSVVVTINTTDVPNGTSLQYEIYPQERSTDVSPSTGTVNVNSNSATFGFSVLADAITEGNETYGIILRRDGSEVFRSGTIYTILDTSLTGGLNVTPGNFTVEFGESVTITITPVNFGTTTINWTLSGSAVDDNLILGPTSDSVTTGSATSVNIQIVSSSSIRDTRQFILTATEPVSGVTKNSGTITVNSKPSAASTYEDNIEIFYTDTTYTIPEGCTSFQLALAGGGGGGGGGLQTGNFFSAGGGGASGGAIRTERIQRTSLMNTIEIKIGTAGSGGAGGTSFNSASGGSNGTDGQNGGDTIVRVGGGTALIAYGGGGGKKGNIPGPRSDYQNGGITRGPAGSNGSPGRAGDSPTNAFGGNGGTNFLIIEFPDPGNDGLGGTTGAGNGNNGAKGGGGGGGGASGASATSLGTLQAQSSHFNFPSVTFIKKDGASIAHNFTRGHTVAVFNAVTLALESVTSYDTWFNGSDALLAAFQAIPDGKVVAVASIDATNFNAATRAYANSVFGTTQGATWEGRTTNNRIAHVIVAQKNGTLPAYEAIHSANSTMPLMQPKPIVILPPGVGGGNGGAGGVGVVVFAGFR